MGPVAGTDHTPLGLIVKKENAATRKIGILISFVCPRALRGSKITSNDTKYTKESTFLTCRRRLGLRLWS
jgi:hypothetical protein